MHELIEAMLTICAWFAEDYGSCMDTLFESQPRLRACFTITLHVKLLDMSREPKQSLTVRENSSRFNTTNVSVVEAEKAKHSSRALSEISLKR